MKKANRMRVRRFRHMLPYILMAAATIAVVFVGSLDKTSSKMNLSLNVFAENNYKVSVDQLSELYVVADLSDALGLASASDVANNYVLTTSMYEAGQTSAGKTEKPNIVDLPGDDRGVKEYIVGEGETMDAIAAKYGLTTDQIRWSNGLKTTAVATGMKLYIPTKPGIVYVVKANDTIDSIVSRYGGNADEIIALNDLEVSGIAEGMRILIKDGTLPTTERPEYVAPVTQYYYTYLGNTLSRQNIQILGKRYGLGGPYVAGQCTQWAWYNRQDLPSTLGNANTWAVRAAAAGYVVNHTPSVGAIFQTTAGWYGHVGYVEALNGDGSITVTEMNYNYKSFQVIRSVIPASTVGNFNYIHRK